MNSFDQIPDVGRGNTNVGATPFIISPKLSVGIQDSMRLNSPS